MPFASVTSAAAAMLAADPPSAWHPPTSAAKVHLVAIKTPMMPLARKALAISSSDRFISSAMAMTAPGNAAQAPAVGAATITPIELFTSISAVT